MRSMHFPMKTGSGLTRFEAARHANSGYDCCLISRFPGGPRRPSSSAGGGFSSSILAPGKAEAELWLSWRRQWPVGFPPH